MEEVVFIIRIISFMTQGESGMFSSWECVECFEQQFTGAHDGQWEDPRVFLTGQGRESQYPVSLMFCKRVYLWLWTGRIPGAIDGAMICVCSDGGRHSHSVRVSCAEEGCRKGVQFGYIFRVLFL